MRIITLNEIIGEMEGEDDAVEIKTRPLYVVTDKIRSFTGRREDPRNGEVRTGTRITYANGTANVVTQTPEDILQILSVH